MSPSTDVTSAGWYFDRTTPTTPAGEERVTVVARERADAVGDLREREPGREQRVGAARRRRVGAAPVERVERVVDAHVSCGGVGAGLIDAARDPVPDLERERRADRRLPASSSPISLAPHPGWTSTLTGSPSPPGGLSCQTNQAVAAIETTRARPDPTHRRRRRCCTIAKRRRLTAGRDGAVRGIGTAGGAGTATAPSSTAIAGLRTVAGRVLGHRLASSHDCRITVAAAASIFARALGAPDPRVAQALLGRHRGEALIVGVDLDAGGARQPPAAASTSASTDLAAGPRLPVERQRQADHDPVGADLAGRPRRCASVVGGHVIGAQQHPERAGEHAGGVAGRETDAALPRSTPSTRLTPRSSPRPAAPAASGSSASASSTAPTFGSAPDREVGLLGGAPTQRLRRVAGDVGGRHAGRDVVLGHRDHEAGLGAVGAEADQAHDAPTVAASASRVGDRERAELVGRRARRGATTTTPSAAPSASVAASAPACLRPLGRELGLERAHLIGEARDAVGQLAGAHLERAASSRSCTSSSWMRSSATSPVTASMRRRLAPIDPSLTILIGPMKPSACTCVPPHSSIECSPASSTRTRSPYLSPKNAIAPSCLGLAPWSSRSGAPARRR